MGNSITSNSSNCNNTNPSKNDIEEQSKVISNSKDPSSFNNHVNNSGDIIKNGSKQCSTKNNEAKSVVTPFENPQRWMGQNTFPILVLTDDNMIGEHYKTRMKMLYGCPFEKNEKEFFFRLTTFFS